jgi:hypothetical protein
VLLVGVVVVGTVRASAVDAEAVASAVVCCAEDAPAVLVGWQRWWRGVGHEAMVSIRADASV